MSRVDVKNYRREILKQIPRDVVKWGRILRLVFDEQHHLFYFVFTRPINCSSININFIDKLSGGHYFRGLSCLQILWSSTSLPLNFYKKLKQRLTIGQVIKIKGNIIQFGDEERCEVGKKKGVLGNALGWGFCCKGKLRKPFLIFFIQLSQSKFSFSWSASFFLLILEKHSSQSSGYPPNILPFSILYSDLQIMLQEGNN